MAFERVDDPATLVHEMNRHGSVELGVATMRTSGLGGASAWSSRTRPEPTVPREGGGMVKRKEG